MSDGTSLDALGRQVEEMTAKLKAALSVMEESKSEDGARWQAANEERIRLATEIGGLKASIDRMEREDATTKAVAEMRDFLQSVRSPGKAGLVGGNAPQGPGPMGRKGDFLLGLHLANSRDAEEQAQGKAMLAESGAFYQRAWGEGGTANVPGGALAGMKATVGSTAATGGWIVPNAVVDDLVRTAPYRNPLAGFITRVTGVTAPGVDIPFRSAQVSRAVVAAYGEEKENRDLAYNGYTATMYTMALIYDLGKQFVRQSAGAAEADVRATLEEAFALGERYYIMSGSGTSEPYGLLTALTNSPATFTSSFSPSATTLAGSVATAIATCAGALSGRNRTDGLVAIMASADYWPMLSQGTDTAGYFFAPANGPQAIEGVPQGTLVSPFGIPVVPDSAMTADRLVVGQMRALKVYYGEAYRVDSSDVAGTRWDKNLVGFRGELEIGLDARPAVYAGAFQQVTNLIA